MISRAEILSLIEQVQSNWTRWQEGADESELDALTHAITGDLETLVAEIRKDTMAGN